MGASKRIAEMLVADAARRTGRPYVSVRFGNVLGSTGSVVPIFQEQLENGEPLTITHPDMTRFFMTIPEAAWLILDAAALGRNGDLFVLDMGEPVRVMDLARDLVRLAGRDPDSQPIETIGLRPGEKLHEELFYDIESVEPTAERRTCAVPSRRCRPPTCVTRCAGCSRSPPATARRCSARPSSATSGCMTERPCFPTKRWSDRRGSRRPLRWRRSSRGRAAGCATRRRRLAPILPEAARSRALDRARAELRRRRQPARSSG